MNSPRRSSAIFKQISLADALPIASPERQLLKNNLEPVKIHGGLRSLNKRKVSRPFQPKAAVHIVLQSSRAKGAWSLQHRKHQAKIMKMVYVYAERFKVRVFRASCAGYQIQLLVKAAEKKQLSDYLRVLAGRVAVTVTGAKRGVKKIGKFWDHLCWSRLVNWGRDFYQAQIQVRDHIEPFALNEVDTEPSPEFDWKKVPVG